MELKSQKKRTRAYNMEFEYMSLETLLKSSVDLLKEISIKEDSLRFFNNKVNNIVRSDKTVLLEVKGIDGWGTSDNLNVTVLDKVPLRELCNQEYEIRESEIKALRSKFDKIASVILEKMEEYNK